MDELYNLLNLYGLDLTPKYIWTEEGNGGKSELYKFVSSLPEENADKIVELIKTLISNQNII
jgi:hypothetical protein